MTGEGDRLRGGGAGVWSRHRSVCGGRKRPVELLGHSRAAHPALPAVSAGAASGRIYDFPGCWDGRRTDSPNHHEHVAFAAPNGACPPNTFPIPRLHLEVGYVVAPGHSFAIDAFPDQRRSPVTDHAQFVNVMP